MSDIKIAFMSSGINVNIMKYDEKAMSNTLPPAIYNIIIPPIGSPYLQITTSGIETPKEIYGDIHSKVDTVFRSYDAENKSLGILLTGIKGSGKTMTAGLICQTMLHRNIPVLLVNSHVPIDVLNEIIQSIGEVCVLFDEFGKNYDEDDQNGMLTLFSGVSEQKRMMILTENNEYSINSFMINRPSRLLFHFRHNKLEDDIIIEYCQKFGVSEKYIEEFIIYSKSTTEFTFDILQAIVKQHLLNPELEFKVLASCLNIEQPYSNIHNSCELLSCISIATGESIKIQKAHGLIYENMWRGMGIEFNDSTEIGKKVCKSNPNAKKRVNDLDIKPIEDNTENPNQYFDVLNITKSQIIKFDFETGIYKVIHKVYGNEFMLEIKESVEKVYNHMA